MKRLVLILHGRVQGVGLRYAVRACAHQDHLRGLVRNELDGTVKIIAEGTVDDLDALLRWLRHPPAGSIEQCEVVWETPTGEFADFSIR